MLELLIVELPIVQAASPSLMAERQAHFFTTYQFISTCRHFRCQHTKQVTPLQAKMLLVDQIK